MITQMLMGHFPILGQFRNEVHHLRVTGKKPMLESPRETECQNDLQIFLPIL